MPIRFHLNIPRALSPTLWLWLCLLLAPARCPAEETVNVDFNYVYSAILGTGYYTAGTERVLVLRIPFSWRLPPINEKNRLKLLFPISGGVRDIINEEDEFEFPDQLLTASFLPGVAWEHLARPNWMLVPSLQIGGAKDFQLDTSAWIGSLALNSFAWWDIGKHRLGLGNRVLGATQYNVDTDNQSGFVLLESGFDWDYRWPWLLFGRPISSSLYFIWQHYSDEVKIDAISGEEVGLDNVFQLGATFGFREPISILNLVPIQRVGVAIGRGNTISGGAIRSITLNLGFPLEYP